MPIVLKTNLGILHQQDVLELLDTLPQVDTVFADPPFNLGKDYGPAVDDKLDTRGYESWCHRWIWCTWEKLAPGGAMFIYHMPEWLVRLGGWMQQLPHYQFRHWIACYMPTRPPIHGRLHPSHYGILYVTKGKPRVFHRTRVPIPTCRHCGKDLKDYGGHRKELKDGLSLSDLWSDTHGVHHRKHKFGRKAPALPEFMPERCILSTTDPGDVVFEPFAGSATASAMAERHERQWIASEIGDCGPAIARIEAEQ